MKPVMKIDEYGTTRWYLHGKLHREDGTECWYINGKLHRDNGPAMIFVDGEEYWYFNGKELVSSDIETIKTIT